MKTERKEALKATALGMASLVNLAAYGVVGLFVLVLAVALVLERLVSNFGWPSATLTTVDCYEIAFASVLLFSFAFWLFVTFVRPLFLIAEYNIAKSDHVEARPPDLVSPLFASGVVAWVLVAAFFVFVAAEFHFGGTFFKPKPDTLLNSLLSGLDILTDKTISTYLKDTDFDPPTKLSALEPSKLRNKLIVTVIQWLCVLGLLRIAVTVLKLVDPKSD